MCKRIIVFGDVGNLSKLESEFTIERKKDIREYMEFDYPTDYKTVRAVVTGGGLHWTERLHLRSLQDSQCGRIFCSQVTPWIHIDPFIGSPCITVKHESNIKKVIDCVPIFS